MHRKDEKLSALLRDALTAIEHGRRAFACESKVEKEIAALRLNSREEYLDVVHECIQIALCDPVSCHRPPQDRISTYHDLTRGLPMEAFVVWHDSFKTNIYFKFCLKTLPDGTHYLHIDCHESD